MEQERLIFLIRQFEGGRLTRAEWEELSATLGDDQDKNNILEALASEMESHTPAPVFLDKDYSALLVKITDIDKTAPSPLRIRRIPVRIKWIAAASVLLLMAGTALWFARNADRTGSQSIARSTSPDLPPGGNHATLTLAGGQRIILDSAANGNLARQGTSQVQKLAGGQLVYNPSGDHSHSNLLPLVYNTLSTPRGGQYHLTLPDGSRVWLNAASSITYPTAFTGHERKLTIRGEAYFEVTKDPAKPFLVVLERDPGHGSPMEIEVLGTSFNINAYDDEPVVAATLLQGAVRLRSGPDNAILHPGQQGRMLPERIQVNNDIDTSAVLAWKNGNFRFVRADMATVLRQLSRWYDIDAQYKGTIDAHFGGTISRDVPLSRVIQMLEATGAVKFIIEGKKLIVMPEK